MAIDAAHVTVKPVERPLNLIPVGLKEAALDSPTFRATAVHFSEQIDAIERWLDGYAKAASKLSAEIASVEVLVNAFLAQTVPPAQISEAVLDHDYALLAAQRYSQGARDFWHTILRGIKRYDVSLVDPVRSFVQGEFRAFKESRRALDASQKSYDSVVSRYMSQNKSKEASSLREDAFQLHEARKAYLKASMDFCISAPQVRTSLDRLVVRISCEQWRDVQACREANTPLFVKWSSDMERVRGWSREMENSERAFKRELLSARQQIEESALTMTKPSRDMDDYAAAQVSYLDPTARTNQTGPASQSYGAAKAEKQGWLFLRTVSGKPARTVWSRRWFYVKNGIFGWLVQGSRSGGVEESEKTGVLLCGVRPSPQEERRFCFEVKTKDTSVILQAETQQELADWISAFEHAKRKALEDPHSTEALSTAQGVDPAFAITAPVAPEFAAKFGDGHGQDDTTTAPSTSDAHPLSSQSKPGADIVAARRVMSIDREKDGEGSRDHATRIIQKLDLHKRSATNTSSQMPQMIGSGGIASLISASHNVLPVGPGPSPGDVMRKTSQLSNSTLAPASLANPPAPTNLSHTAVVMSSERGISLGRADGSGTPSGVMANLWGSSHWGYVNRIADEPRSDEETRSTSATSSPGVQPAVTQDDVGIMDGMGATLDGAGAEKQAATDEDAAPRHRKTISVGNERLSGPDRPLPPPSGEHGFPNNYPIALKAQQAQFRMLFPHVPSSEKVVMVFRASWNPNDQQEFPGRVYATEKEIYFFSNHLGFVLITGVRLKAISEVTAAPGRDCDYLYLHLKERNQHDELRRVTVKVFLEPLRLLQRRLAYLVRNAGSEKPEELESILKAVIKMETEALKRSSSAESWEDLTYEDDDAEIDETSISRSSGQARQRRNVQASLRIDGALYTDPAKTGREIQKFKLPSQPVAYTPQGMQAGITRDFNVSAKALFHVIFGDKSAVFQLLYANRWVDKVVQTSWTKSGDASHWRRSFSSQLRNDSTVDVQTIDIINDHLCYSVTNAKHAWRLPYSSRFVPTTKIVITHTAKSRSKLAIFQQVVWQRPPALKYIERIIERQALSSLEADALDLTNVAMDQVAKLGHHSKTNRAIEIFGGIGQVKQAQINAASIPNGAAGAVGLPQRGTSARPTRLSRLVVDDMLLRALGTVGWILDVCVAVGKTVLNACSAHSVLLALLLVSACYNTWYSYRESLTWFEERRASTFMARMGVVPERVMSKTVYLADIEELAVRSWPSFARPGNSSMLLSRTCLSTFEDNLLGPTDADTQRSGTARLQRSRTSLARSRHDLLVALRVLNRVESEVVSAAWEDHLRAEQQRCDQVEEMLQRHNEAKSTSGMSDMTSAELGADFADYCQSCRQELETVGEDRAASLL